MRFVLGALVLLTVFALATRWQDRWTDEVRADRDRAFERQELPSDDRAPVLGRVIVGLESGAPPYARDASSSGGTAPPATRADAPAAGAEKALAAPAGAPSSAQSSALRVFELKVERGQQLGELCRKHYGSARRELVESLARYNGMASPDALREGQLLRLPPIETLIGESR